MQADQDRAFLKKKWGCNAWDESYAAMFDEDSFDFTAKQVKSMREHNHL
jgi:hypothetical protein